MKKLSISISIGTVFVLLLLVLRTASASLPGDITTRWNGTYIHAPLATTFLVSLLIAGLFYVLTSVSSHSARHQ